MKKKALIRELRRLNTLINNTQWILNMSQDKNRESADLLFRVAACEPGSAPMEDALHDVKVFLGLSMPNIPMIRR